MVDPDAITLNLTDPVPRKVPLAMTLAVLFSRGYDEWVSMAIVPAAWVWMFPHLPNRPYHGLGPFMVFAFFACLLAGTLYSRIVALVAMRKGVLLTGEKVDAAEIDLVDTICPSRYPVLRFLIKIEFLGYYLFRAIFRGIMKVQGKDYSRHYSTAIRLDTGRIVHLKLRAPRAVAEGAISIQALGMEGADGHFIPITWNRAYKQFTFDDGALYLPARRVPGLYAAMVLPVLTAAGLLGLVIVGIVGLIR